MDYSGLAKAVADAFSWSRFRINTLDEFPREIQAPLKRAVGRGLISSGDFVAGVTLLKSIDAITEHEIVRLAEEISCKSGGSDPSMAIELYRLADRNEAGIMAVRQWAARYEEQGNLSLAVTAYALCGDTERLLAVGKKCEALGLCSDAIAAYVAAGAPEDLLRLGNSFLQTYSMSSNREHLAIARNAFLGAKSTEMLIKVAELYLNHKNFFEATQTLNSAASISDGHDKEFYEGMAKSISRLEV